MRYSSLLDVAKVCTKCRVLKGLDEFPKSTRRGHGPRPKSRCRVCDVADNRERYLADPDAFKAREAAWRAKNPEKRRALARANHVKRTYGLDAGEEQAMLARQNGACAVCAAPIRPAAEGGPRWDWVEVDHDHATNAVRGLLCGSCNRMLGHCRNEDPAVLRAAAAYLEAHR